MAKLINKLQHRFVKKFNITKEPHISKNFFYSLGLHLALILIIYLSFNLGHKAISNKKEKVVINFVLNNKEQVRKLQENHPKPQEKEVEKEPEKIPEKPKEEPKKEDPKPKELKPEKKKEKPKPKEPKKKVEKKPEKKPEKKIEKKPEKKPEKKVEKKVEKKPEPKKEEVKPEKKQDKKIEETKKEELVQTSKEEAPILFTEKTIEKLNLPIRDKFNIQSQIVGCYKRAIEQFGGKSNETIMVHIKLDRDGSINQKDMIIKDYDRYSDPAQKEFKRAVDIVKQTISFCSPLRKMPEDKYNIWKEIDLQFSDSVVSN